MCKLLYIFTFKQVALFNALLIKAGINFFRKLLNIYVFRINNLFRCESIKLECSSFI